MYLAYVGVILAEITVTICGFIGIIIRTMKRVGARVYLHVARYAISADSKLLTHLVDGTFFVFSYVSREITH